MPIVAVAWIIQSGHAQDRLNEQLLQSIEKCDAAAVRALLARGADPNARERDPRPWWAHVWPRWSLVQGPGDTALMVSFVRLERGDPHPQAWECVAALLAAGADPNTRGFLGTPLCVAAEFGDIRAVRALLDAGADPNGRGANDETPLMAAAWFSPSNKGQVEAFLLLLERGADPHLKMEGTDTALFLAAINDRPEMVEALLERRVDMEAKDGYFGATPLTIASSNGSVEVARLLLKYGARRDARDKDGKTALDRAIANRNQEIVRLLKSEQIR